MAKQIYCGSLGDYNVDVGVLNLVHDSDIPLNPPSKGGLGVVRIGQAVPLRGGKRRRLLEIKENVVKLYKKYCEIILIYGTIIVIICK